MALPTHGRVVLDTTAGDIEIELWSKEAPRACRNFIALALEGYYDGVIFHRVIPDFLIQTGDRTGSGGGGESFYGEPFPDEIHPRLRFAHRGLVGCANGGQKNSNDSQFFITLSAAEELNGKHTLWGRCVGDTFFNALKIGQTELGENERPVYPPKIRTVRVVDNPFDDIVPRITAAEKRAQQRAREAAQREREEESRRKGAKKNTGLLSFGLDAGTVEDEEPAIIKKKPMVRPDLIDDPTVLGNMPETIAQAARTKVPKEKKPVPVPAETDAMDVDVLKIREKHAQEKKATKTAREIEIDKMEADIRKLARRRGDSDSDSEAERQAKKAKGPSLLQQELAKYSKGPKTSKKGARKDETDILAALSNFRSKIRSNDEDPADAPQPDSDGERAAREEDATEDQDVEVDDDVGWLRHRLNFPKDDGKTTEQALDHYEVIDPRARGKQAKEEEKERKQNSRRAGPSHVFKAGPPRR